jgi:hypothetical protein
MKLPQEVQKTGKVGPRTCALRKLTCNTHIQESKKETLEVGDNKEKDGGTRPFKKGQIGLKRTEKGPWSIRAILEVG